MSRLRSSEYLRSTRYIFSDFLLCFFSSFHPYSQSPDCPPTLQAFGIPSYLDLSSHRSLSVRASAPPHIASLITHRTTHYTPHPHTQTTTHTTHHCPHTTTSSLSPDLPKMDKSDTPSHAPLQPESPPLGSEPAGDPAGDRGVPNRHIVLPYATPRDTHAGPAAPLVRAPPVSSPPHPHVGVARR